MNFFYGNKILFQHATYILVTNTYITMHNSKEKFTQTLAVLCCGSLPHHQIAGGGDGLQL
jgi:hypothetical protein